VKTLIGAGYDTTASSLAWVVSEATRSAGTWSGLREEASRVLDHGDVRVASLELAGRTVRETLRLHPGSGIGARVAATEMNVGGCRIARNAIVAWSPYLTGRHPATFAEADRFRPERWLEADDETRAAADLAWMPFGRGPRSCVGFALAQMQLTLIVGRLAQRVDLTPVTAAIPPAEGLVVSRPRGGVVMVVGPAASRAVQAG
jgi:cytochrome P450